jgi:protein-L-isoaspartate(D-aspartate) O-methyltransferase
MYRSRGARRGAVVLVACAVVGAAHPSLGGRTGHPEMPEATSIGKDPYVGARRRMVRDQIERRGVRDARVLAAMAEVPRHLFVPESLRGRAYEDGPLPIGGGQTISQPYIVAFMTEAARLRPGDRVLEVGTGSGYQAAVLASIAAHVYTIEIRSELAEEARARLAALGYRNVTVRAGDGHAGWAEEAPFDAVMVTAAPEAVPPALVAQLATGGRLVIPIGSEDQQLVRLTRTPDGVERETLLPVRFVPMTGSAATRPD